MTPWVSFTAGLRRIARRRRPNFLRRRARRPRHRRRLRRGKRPARHAPTRIGQDGVRPSASKSAGLARSAPARNEKPRFVDEDVATLSDQDRWPAPEVRGGASASTCRASSRAPPLARFRGDQRKRGLSSLPVAARFLVVCAGGGGGGEDGLVRGHAGGRPGKRGRAAEMRRCARTRPGAPALDVVQAGLGSLQRSTGLVRGPGRAGGTALGLRRGGPQRPGGLAPPWGNGLWCSRGPLLACAWLAAWPAVMRPWRGGGRVRRRRSGHPTGCRAPSATRSSAAATRRTPHGPVRG